MSAIDFSGAIGGAGIALQGAAFNTFGAVVDEYTRGLFDQSYNGSPVDYGTPNTDGVYIPGSSYGNPNTIGYSPTPTMGGNGREWLPTGYAEDLIKYQPKHRFLFKVIFTMNPEYFDKLGPELFLGENNNRTFQYVIKRIDRPKFTFDYEEVNMYNFRTKVLKSIKHEPLGITFIDDIQDTFHNFFTQTLRAYSPSSRTWNESINIHQIEQSGFAFGNTKSEGTSGMDSALRGVLERGAFNIFSKITIIQYFGHGSQQNVFHFINPRILDMSYDEAHHEGGDAGNHAEMKFDFDILYIEDATQNKMEYEAPLTDVRKTQIQPDERAYMSPYFISTGSQNSEFHTNPILNPSNANNSFFGNSSYNTGITGQILNTATGILGGVVRSAVGNITNQALRQVSNPFINTAARNIVSGTTRQLGNSASNTLFGITRPFYSNVNTITGPSVTE